MSNNWMIVLMGLSPFVLIFIWIFISPDSRMIRRAEKADEEWCKNNPYIPPTEEELQEAREEMEASMAFLTAKYGDDWEKWLKHFPHTGTIEI